MNYGNVFKQDYFFFSWIIYLIIFIIASKHLKLLILPNQYLVKTSVEIFSKFHLYFCCPHAFIFISHTTIWQSQIYIYFFLVHNIILKGKSVFTL